MYLQILCYLGYSDYCPHLYCYIHNVSADVTSGLHQVLPVELGNLLTHRPKRCEYNNKDEDNSPNNLDNTNNQASSQKFRKTISNRYGPGIIQQWKQLEKLNQKLARMTNHLTFLYRCRDLKLVPPGLTLKLPVNSRRAQKIAKRVGHELVRDRIQNNRWKKHQLQSEISNKLTAFLDRISINEDRTRIQQYLELSYKQEFQEVKSRQIRKLERMKTRVTKEQAHYTPVDAIVNISRRQLSTSEKTVLNKGLNFATTIKRIPYLDLIAPIEEAALNIPKARADEVESETSTREIEAS